MRERSAAVAVLAAIAALAAGCGGGGGVVTVAGVEATQVGAGAAFHVPHGAAVLHAGPGPVRAGIARDGYRLRIVLRPNRAERRNRVSVSVRRLGRPASATVRLDAGMLDMAMGVASFRLGSGAGHHALLPAWGMPGRWGRGLTVTPAGARPIHVVVDDRMS